MIFSLYNKVSRLDPNQYNPKYDKTQYKHDSNRPIDMSREEGGEVEPQISILTEGVIYHSTINYIR